jgi:hypothetical protein
VECAKSAPTRFAMGARDAWIVASATIFAICGRCSTIRYKTRQSIVATRAVIFYCDKYSYKVR